MTAATPQPQPETGSWTKGFKKLGVASLLFALALGWVGYHTWQLKQFLSANPQYQANQLKPENLEKAIPLMKETNDLLMNWSVVLLGATLGIAILGKGPKIRDHNWGMVLIPPTWALLLFGSLRNGSEFKRSLTFQLADGKFQFPDLNLYLYLQLDFFRHALYVLAVLAAFYLSFRFALMEERSRGGE